MSAFFSTGRLGGCTTVYYEKAERLLTSCDKNRNGRQEERIQLTWAVAFVYTYYVPWHRTLALSRIVCFQSKQTLIVQTKRVKKEVCCCLPVS